MKRKRGIFEKEVLILFSIFILFPLVFCIFIILILFLKRILKIFPVFVFNSIFLFLSLLIVVYIFFHKKENQHSIWKEIKNKKIRFKKEKDNF
jgi:positive regulator of sigma E activity